jgi:translation initiation factor IF-3
VNEKLISALCSKHRSSPESLQVRLILKLDGSEATTNQVTSLSDAIQLSLKHEKDLIGIAVNQEVPVLKVDSLQRLAYEAKKTQNKNRMGSLPEKEFRFNTWIAENDFQRKMDGVLQSLSRGHSCMISIVAGSKSKVPDAARAMATSIIERAWQAGESTNQLKGSSNNRVVQFRLRPTSGARRNKE